MDFWEFIKPTGQRIYRAGIVLAVFLGVALLETLLSVLFLFGYHPAVNWTIEAMQIFALLPIVVLSHIGLNIPMPWLDIPRFYDLVDFFFLESVYAYFVACFFPR